jgi:hypothetical protein
VYLETETQKALYFWEYTFDVPEMLCPLSGTFNTSEVAQYAFYAGAEEKEVHLLDAETLSEYKIMLQKDAVGEGHDPQQVQKQKSGQLHGRKAQGADGHSFYFFLRCGL